MSQESRQREEPGPLPRVMFAMLRWVRPRIITPIHIRLYQLLGGRLVGRDNLLLTTTGRRSGRPRTVMVDGLRDGDDLIVRDVPLAKASFPPRVLNLRAHLEAEVRLGREQYQVRAESVEGGDRATQWNRLVAATPALANLQRLAGRQTAIMRLNRIGELSG